MNCNDFEYGILRDLADVVGNNG